MTKYLLLNKQNIKYIDILIDYLPIEVIKVKYNLNGLDLEKDILIIIDIKILELALKLGFKNIYYFNIEQMSIRVDFDNGISLSRHASQVNKNILNQYFKIINISKNNNNNIIKFYNKFKLLDYSLENVDIWKKIYNIDITGIIEPFYPVVNSISKNDKLDSKFNCISLINHDYRPIIINNFLPNIKNTIVNILGYYNNDRRNLLKKSKILINIHTSQNHRIGELFRINEALAHKVIIISQKSEEPELITFKDYIIFVNDNELENKCYEILNKYEYYYSKYFEGDSLSRLTTLMKNIEQKNINIFNQL
jgi:hypothetical protein